MITIKKADGSTVKIITKRPRGGPRKLTPAQEATMIRRRVFGGEAVKALCLEFGINAETFRRIKMRTSLQTFTPGLKPTQAAAAE